jgi:ribosome-associated protein
MAAEQHDSTTIAEMISELADDMKAERIEHLDVREKTSVADFFVVCTGTSDTHVRSIAERVAERLRERGIRPVRSEMGDSGWVLQDFGDVIFHVMREEKRQFYDLESLWQQMERNPDLIIQEPGI